VSTEKIGPWVGCAVHCGQIPHLADCPRHLLGPALEAFYERGDSSSKLAEVAKILGKRDDETIQDAARRAVTPMSKCATRGCDWVEGAGSADDVCRVCGDRRNFCVS
jgi:hypothetical protein